MKNRSKRYKSAYKLVEEVKAYSLKEALEILGQMPKTKFNETVEISAALGVDAKQSDQMVRGMVNLPHGSGRTVRILAFTERPEEAMAAGADFAGLEDMLKKVLDGWIDFDIAIATPEAMKSIRSAAKILGPRGLMPSPKSGTVTEDLEGTIKSFKEGRVEFKMDKAANVSIVIGKRSFEKGQLLENAFCSVEALLKSIPKEFKGESFIRSLTLSSTMSPGLRLDQGVFTTKE